MKGIFYKVVLFILVLLASGQVIYAQRVEDNPEVRNYLDNMFSTLDKGKVPSRLLKDYAFDLTDLDRHTGSELTDKNYVDREVYSYLLRTVRSAAVGKKPFGDVNEILAVQYSAGSSNIIALSALAYQYSFIVENAISDEYAIILRSQPDYAYKIYFGCLL